jgi:hypothetical protein
MKTAELIPSNVVSMIRKPTLVLDRPVYDLNSTRRRSQFVSQAEYAGKCPNGICVVNWKPTNKPAA